MHIFVKYPSIGHASIGRSWIRGILSTINRAILIVGSSWAVETSDGWLHWEPHVLKCQKAVARKEFYLEYGNSMANRNRLNSEFWCRSATPLISLDVSLVASLFEPIRIAETYYYGDKTLYRNIAWIFFLLKNTNTSLYFTIP
jgi:hypothetical protein